MENEYQSVRQRSLPRQRPLFERRLTAIGEWLKAQGTPPRVASIVVALITKDSARTICEDEKIEVPKH